MFTLKFNAGLLLSGLFGTTFVVLTYLMLKGFLLPVDNLVNQLIPQATSGFLYIASRGLAVLYIPLILAVVLLFFRFMVRGKRSEAIFVLTSFSGSIVAEAILKPIFKIPCPVTSYGDFLADQEVFGLIHKLQTIGLVKTCYPSGHVTGYIVLCGYLSFLTMKLVKTTWLRTMLLIVLFTIMILIGPARLYLHLHWFSDVVAGYFLGFVLLLMIIALHKKLQPSQ